MKRTTKKGPTVRSLTRRINELQDQNCALYGRLSGARQIESEASIRTEAPADNAVTAAVKAAAALGFRVYVTTEYKGGLNYVAEKHTRA